MPYDRSGHYSDGAGARDEHIFAEYRKRQCGMNGIAKRIKNRRDLGIHFRSMMPDVGHGDADVFRESAGTIHPNSLGVPAQVSAARETIPATATDDVPFGTDSFAWV